ncbi:hypothetical protein [Vibrio pectenicida]|uniref:Uncharacterized protein n=1 Tax=Vibrio pectenicida TaxID=62763 RepID=A0A3R9EBI1_9VIBR|nr:hypothetical protein [Vibrio pectenicida]RSD30270.1 hypothetical protein EJA03_14715 [Vibrio pectenicida]
MWESPATAISWLKKNNFSRTAASVEFANCPFPRFQVSDLGTTEAESHVRYAALILQILGTIRPELITRPILLDVEQSHLFGNRDIIYLSNNLILPKVKTKPFDFLFKQIMALESELVNPHERSVKRYFDNQRRRTAQILATQHQSREILEFKKLFDDNQNEMAAHPRTHLTRKQSKVYDYNAEGAPIVFMGMKAVPENVVNAILKNGLIPLRYLYNQQVMEMSSNTLRCKNDRQSKYLRRRFVLDLPRTNGNQLDVFQLLQLANAHKSGPGVSTSGFHSTSGKPSYAVEYSRGSASSTTRQASYNMGLAIKITPLTYPLIVQYAIETWNRGGDDRKIVMSYTKSDDNWKHDYESEILLGGCTPASDLVYVGLAKVEAKAVGMQLGGLLGQLSAGKKLRKTSRSKTPSKV